MRTPVVALLLVALPAAAAAQVRFAAPTRNLTLIPVGAPPIGLRAGTAPTSIGLRWGCPDGASGYDVYVTPSSGVQVKLTPTPIPGQCVQDVQAGFVRGLPGAPAPSTSPTYSTGFTHSGLAPQSSYTYVVVALYPNGAQGASPRWPPRQTRSSRPRSPRRPPRRATSTSAGGR